MPTKREILEQFRRDELIDEVDYFELEVTDRRVKALLIEALAKSRRATLAIILEGLKRDRLKELCRDFGLDDSGRAKAILVERLTSKATPSAGIPEKKTTSRKTRRPVQAAPEGVEEEAKKPIVDYRHWLFGNVREPTIIAKHQEESTTKVSQKNLDGILTLQLTVAWVGEVVSAPERPGWWRTGQVNLRHDGSAWETPRIFGWTSLSTARKAASQVDRQARYRMARPEKVRTLFFWGFDINEQLEERLAKHKGDGKEPTTALPLPFALDRLYDRAEIENMLREDDVGEIKTRTVSDGRLIVGALPKSLILQARQLTTALLPLSDRYPLPFFQLED